jgi:hypothetical protein
MRRIILISVLALAGCAHITPRDNPPVHSWVLNSSLDDATGCVISALNSVSVDKTGLGKTITHSAEIIVPNSVYEVRPQQEITLTAEMYYVRLAKETPATTRMDLYSISPYAKRMTGAISACVS